MNRTQPNQVSNASLHSLDQEFDALFSDGIDAFDEHEFARAWAAMGVHRDHMLINLARKCRYHYRKHKSDQVMASGSTLAAPSTADDVPKLTELLNIACEFAFRYLSKRQIVFFMDALALAFEADMDNFDTFIWVMGGCAAQCQSTSPGRVEAAVTGVAGVHRHDIERIAELDALDKQS